MIIKSGLARRSVALILCLSVLVAVSVLVMQSGKADARLPAAGNSASVNAQDAPEARVKTMVRVWIHGDEIYPSALQVRPGKIVLRAENETQSDISLVVERLVPGQSRQAVTKVKTTSQGKRADQEIELGVGEYIYYEESQPELVGTLSVEPR